MTAPPTLFTFDPQIAGMVAFRVTPAATVDQVILYVADKPGGPYTEAGFVTIGAGRDGLRVCLDADATMRYWVAKTHDGAGYTGVSNAVAAAGSTGPPVLTGQQELEQALGVTLDAGCVVEVFPPTPTLTRTVQADGSLA